MYTKHQMRRLIREWSKRNTRGVLRMIILRECKYCDVVALDWREKSCQGCGAAVPASVLNALRKRVAAAPITVTDIVAKYFPYHAWRDGLVNWRV